MCNQYFFHGNPYALAKPRVTCESTVGGYPLFTGKQLFHKLERANARSPQRESSMNKLLLLIIAILLPPLAAYLQVGATKHLWLNIVLCLFVWVPGILHAVWLVLTDTRA
jgi:uncharacterized membrane protein YqaE (UPF0057 family)